MRYYSGMNITATSWLKKVSENRADAGAAFVAGLSGHLGAGKTAFVKAIAEGLGVKEVVTSPTFVVMKIYEVDMAENAAFKRLIHIDAYRLERREDLEALRFEEIVADPHNLVMIEWPENVGLASDSVGGDSSRGGLNVWLRFEIKEGVYTITDKSADK